MYGVRLLRQRPVQIAALGILSLVVLAFRALQFGLLTRQEQWGYDFSFYWTAARHVLNGEAIYSAAQLAGPYAPQGQDGFLYPPPFAAIVTPFAALFSDARTAEWVWTALGAAILLASVLALWRSERLGERFPILAGRGRWLLVAAAFAFPPVVGELVLGNVHLILLGLLTLAWLGIRRGDTTGEWIAGLAVVAAAIIKVFPGVLLLWFLLMRRYRAAAGVLVGAGVLTLVTVPVTGIEPWLQYPTVLANLSAPADTTDTLAPTVWLAPLLGFTAARVLVTIVGLALLAWSAIGVRRPAGSTAGSSDAAATARSFALAVTVAVLIAPAVYQHYLALLVLPVILGLGAGVSLPARGLAYLLMWGGQQDAWGDVAWIVNSALPTLGALLLLGALAVRGGRRARPAPSAGMQAGAGGA